MHGRDAPPPNAYAQPLGLGPLGSCQVMRGPKGTVSALEKTHQRAPCAPMRVRGSEPGRGPSGTRPAPPWALCLHPGRADRLGAGATRSPYLRARPARG